MNLKFNHGGDTIIIPTTDEQPSGKRLAIRHDDTIYYAPIVGTDNANASSVKLVFGGGTYALPAIASDTVLPAVLFSDPNDPTNCDAATVYCGFYDFGVIADANSSLGYDPTLANGIAYYPGLKNISVAPNVPNATVICNSTETSILSNVYVTGGGSANVITGGIGKNAIRFTNGSAGIVVGYGIGAAENGYYSIAADESVHIKFATHTDDVTNDTLIGYDRFDPCSYFRGTDRVYCSGTVAEVAYEKCGVAASKMDSLFTAYVTYEYTDDNSNVQPCTVMLPGIVKKPISFVSLDSAGSPTWQTDDVAARSMSIHEGTTKLTSTKIKNLSVPKSVSAYPDNIAYLDALYANMQGGSS